MDPPFSDGGQASSYTNPLLPGNGQQASCVSELAAMDSYYTLSSTVHEHSPGLSDSGSLAPGAIHHHCHRSHNTSRYAAMTSNPQYPPRSHQIWPSPPPGPEEFENYSYHSSPTCGSTQIYFNPSPISPRTWSSPDQTLQQAVDALQQPHAQDPFKILRICTPTSADEFPMQTSQLSTPYTQNFQQSFEGEPDGLSQYHTPATLQDFSSGTLSCTSSPSEPPLTNANSMVVPKIESPLGASVEVPSPVRQPESRESNEATESAKTEEPYAQLIYRAFLSRPDHTLTLQEIYQWFRENTDKASGEGKGWQNSIRHNLSMNAAFTKRERKLGSDSDPTVGDLALADDSKRSNEWVLEDWAVRDGVQSTTRYRKGNHTRRGNGAGSSKRGYHHTYHHGFQQHGNQISTRSVSGRRGPHGTNKLKLHTRYHGYGTTISPTPSSRVMSHGYPIRRSTMPPGMSPYHYDDLMAPRLEPPPQMMIKAEQNAPPLTPDVTAPDSFGSLMPAPGFAHHGTSGTSNGATYATGGLHQGHMYVGPPCEFPYGLAEVTGIYQPGHHSAGAGGGPRPFETIHDGLYGWNEDVL